MNILIKNLSNTFNYGSMMMGENLITYMNMFSRNEINYYIDTDSSIHINRLKKATGYSKIYKDDVFIKECKSSSKVIKKINRELAKRIQFLKYNKKYDYVFILGGDDFSEEYYDVKTEGKYILHMLKDLEMLNKFVPIYMIGQTIGPYTGKRKKLASRVFNKIKLYTRDEKNFEYLSNELHCYPERMHDLAYLDLCLQNDGDNSILKKYKLNKGNYIVIVGTGLAHHYCSNKKNFIEMFCRLIENLEKANADKKIVWLSHVVGTHSSDNNMLNALLKYYPNLKSEITIIEDELMPVDARIILGNAYYNLSCRMHAAVSTYQMGKPCICLSYSPKFAGVIGKEFYTQDLIIEAKDDSLYEPNSSKLLQLVENQTNYIKENYTELCKKIEARVEIIKKENLKIIEDLVKKMEG